MAGKSLHRVMLGRVTHGSDTNYQKDLQEPVGWSKGVSETTSESLLTETIKKAPKSLIVQESGRRGSPNQALSHQKQDKEQDTEKKHT